MLKHRGIFILGKWQKKKNWWQSRKCTDKCTWKKSRWYI